MDIDGELAALMAAFSLTRPTASGKKTLFRRHASRPAKRRFMFRRGRKRPSNRQPKDSSKSQMHPTKLANLHIHITLQDSDHIPPDPRRTTPRWSAPLSKHNLTVQIKHRDIRSSCIRRSHGRRRKFSQGSVRCSYPMGHNTRSFACLFCRRSARRMRRLTHRFGQMMERSVVPMEGIETEPLG
jgi:hypothetical protein